MSGAAISPRTSTRPGTSTVPVTPSSSPSSLGRTGAGATAISWFWTRAVGPSVAQWRTPSRDGIAVAPGSPQAASHEQQRKRRNHGIRADPDRSNWDDWDHRRGPHRTGLGAHGAAGRSGGRDREQPRPGIFGAGGGHTRRRSVGWHGPRGGGSRHRRDRGAVDQRPRWLLDALLTAASTARAVDAPFTVVASGLDNPRGLAFGPEGALYVAEAARAGTGPCITGPAG